MSAGDLVASDDLMQVGEKIIEMADRAKTMHAVIAGAKACCHFEIDDTRFEVVVTVANAAPQGGAQ